METGLYVKYAQQYPESPKAAEALYNAVYRQGVVVTMYTVQEDRKRSQAAAQRTQALAQESEGEVSRSTDYRGARLQASRFASRRAYPSTEATATERRRLSSPGRRSISIHGLHMLDVLG